MFILIYLLSHSSSSNVYFSCRLASLLPSHFYLSFAFTFFPLHYSFSASLFMYLPILFVWLVLFFPVTTVFSSLSCSPCLYYLAPSFHPLCFFICALSYILAFHNLFVFPPLPLVSLLPVIMTFVLSLVFILIVLPSSHSFFSLIFIIYVASPPSSFSLIIFPSQSHFSFSFFLLCVFNYLLLFLLSLFFPFK